LNNEVWEIKTRNPDGILSGKNQNQRSSENLQSIQRLGKLLVNLKIIPRNSSGQVCRDLAQKHGFPGQELKLTELVGYHLLGILPSNEFKDKIKQDLQLSQQTSEILFREVNQIIFEPVRQSLDGLYNKDVEDQGIEVIASESTPPKLELSHTHFEFESVKANKVLRANVTVSNAGGGTLTGSIEPDRLWLKTSRNSIDTSKHKQEIMIHVDTSDQPLGFAETGFIRIKSNGGEEIITVRLSVEIPEHTRLRFETWMGWAGAIMGLPQGVAVVWPAVYDFAVATSSVVSIYCLVFICLRLVLEGWKDYKKHELALWEFIIYLICGTLFGLPIAFGLAVLVSLIPFAGPVIVLTFLSVVHFACLAEPLLKAKNTGNKVILTLLILALLLPTLFIAALILFN